MCTSAPGLQLLLHQFFRRRKLAELDLGHVIVLTNCADHFGLLLVTVLSLNMDPRDFPNDKKIIRGNCVRFFTNNKCRYNTLFSSMCNRAHLLNLQMKNAAKPTNTTVRSISMADPLWMEFESTSGAERQSHQMSIRQMS